ncbi:sensor histidine kinase [Nocardioides sp. SYSU D00065]|uniref:sensor histidine kinase n=1 Tax=Nocardioides sp. SYSU D00065 TaxID=2817378 RepID=UPI001B32A45E|nr:histidine kinase [Nocardioides sp. SYSU D00065]
MLSTHQPGILWRVTTAARVFVLALALGRVLSAGEARGVLLPFVAVVLVATVTCVLEREVPDRLLVWLPLVEGVLVSALLSSNQEAGEYVLVYLAVPAVVGGLRHGWLAVLNTTLAGAVTLLSVTINIGSSSAHVAEAGLFWLGIGLGTGLLAAWQTRALRELIDARAPLVEAHRLLVQLQALAHENEVGFDSSGASEQLGSALLDRVEATRAAVFARHRDGSLVLLWSRGAIEGLEDAAASVTDEVVATPETLCVPVMSEDRVIAVAVLGDLLSWHGEPEMTATRVAASHALRLDTALIFDDVRGLAASEERHRIAREMHDGVAQELVALGYAVDEISSVTEEAQTRELSMLLRAEVTRVVSELRFSIFDLRHDLAGHSLSASLTDYANTVGMQAGLRVHLTLDEAGPPLPSRVQTEILRIAQEAIGNVRRHSRAANLWVLWTTDGDGQCLRIEDDGVGNAAPRAQHYGLHTMRERAEHIGATLTVEDRHGGGTVVEMSSRSPEPHHRKEKIVAYHHRHARR